MSRPRLLGDVVGRQPETLYIKPSKPNPWYGSIVAGDRLTAQQRAALSMREIDQARVEIVTVHRQATTREMYWGVGQPAPLYAFDCPVVSRRADGSATVIAPSGDVKHVYEHDGRWWTFPARAGRGRAAA